MALRILYMQLFETPPIPTKDVTGSTIIITGGNTGLGLDAAKHLYSLGCSHLILACRDTAKGDKAKAEILQSIANTKKQPSSQSQPQQISVWHLDMSSYKSVSAFASRASELPLLHGAILNAGVAHKEFNTTESLESTITVNITSTFLLAILLIPILRKTSLSSTTVPHLSIVGSAAHTVAKHNQLVAASKSTNTKILTNLSDPATVQMSDRYFLSKLIVTQLVVHLAMLLTNSKSTSGRVILNNPSPGWCQTSLMREDESALTRFLSRLLTWSSEEGSRTLVHGVSEAGEGSHGKYLVTCKERETSAFVRSEEGKAIAGRIWEEIVEIAERVVPGCTAEI